MRRLLDGLTPKQSRIDSSTGKALGPAFVVKPNLAKPRQGGRSQRRGWRRSRFPTGGRKRVTVPKGKGRPGPCACTRRCGSLRTKAVAAATACSLAAQCWWTGCAPTPSPNAVSACLATCWLGATLRGVHAVNVLSASALIVRIGCVRPFRRNGRTGRVW